MAVEQRRPGRIGEKPCHNVDPNLPMPAHTSVFRRSRLIDTHAGFVHSNLINETVAIKRCDNANSLRRKGIPLRTSSGADDPSVCETADGTLHRAEDRARAPDRAPYPAGLTRVSGAPGYPISSRKVELLAQHAAKALDRGDLRGCPRGLEPADQATWIACAVSESHSSPCRTAYLATQLLVVAPRSVVSVRR